MASRKKLRTGDLVEVGHPLGFAYLQFVGRHPEYGDCIKVMRGLNAQASVPLPEAFNNSYFAFYPVSAAVNQGLAVVVGNIPAPEFPKALRRPGVRQDGKILSWVIESEDSQFFVLSEHLNASQRALPIAVIWNHEFLLFRLTENWCPANSVFS